jgi:hypothetical protein
MIRKQRVGKLVVGIETGAADDVVSIGNRFSATVDGQVTVLVGTPYGLLVGTTRGVVSRLETATGRQCARYELDAPIDAIVVDGNLVTIRTGDLTTVLLVRSLRVPKRASVARSSRTVRHRRGG